MTLKVPCPHCEQVVSVPRKRAGRTVRCPSCDAKLEVPLSTPPRIPRAGPPSLSEKADSTTAPAPPPIQHKTANRWAEPEQGGDGSCQPAQAAASSVPTPPPLPKLASNHESPGPGEKAAPAPAEAGDGPAKSPTPTPKPPPLNVPRGREETTASTTPARPASGRSEGRKSGDVNSSRSRTAGKPKADSRRDAEPAPAKKGLAASSSPATAPIATSAESSPPESSPDEPPVRGYEHSADRRWTVYQLGAALILAALFGVAPAVLEMVSHVQAVDPPGVSRWAWILVLASGVQLAYAVYLIQLPDWSSVWAVSIVMLAFATVYAMLLGLLMLADSQSPIVQLLELSDARTGHKATGWCLILLSISSLLAYFCGRIGTRWHHAYRIVTEEIATN